MKKLVLSLAVLGLAAGSANAAFEPLCDMHYQHSDNCKKLDGMEHAIKHCESPEKKKECSENACSAGAPFLEGLSAVSVTKDEKAIKAIDWINENGDGCATKTIDAAKATISADHAATDAAAKAKADENAFGIKAHPHS